MTFSLIRMNFLVSADHILLILWVTLSCLSAVCRSSTSALPNLGGYVSSFHLTCTFSLDLCCFQDRFVPGNGCESTVSNV